MTIEKLKSGSYRITKMYKGKRYRVTVDHKPSDKEVLLLMAEEMQRFHGKKKESSTYAEAFRQYIDSRSNVCSPATLRGYRVLFGSTPEWFKKMNVYDIEQIHVQKAVNEYFGTHSPKSTRNLNGLISSVLKLARPEIVLHTKLPDREQKDVYIPSDAEVQAILQRAKGTKYEVAFYLAVFGLRRSEILSLTVDDLEGNMISISKAMVQGADETWSVKNSPKTEASNRKVYVTDYVRDLILKQGYIFQGNPATINHKLQRIEDELGIPQFSLHKLRHYFASMCHEMGISDADTMAMGGWKTDRVMKVVYRHSMADKVSEGQSKYAERIKQMQSA